MNLREAAERFLDHCRISKRLSAHTLRAYGVDLDEFQAFAGADRPADQIDREDLRRFARRLFDERGLKESSVKRRVAALKVMFRWLEREEVVALSPFHRLDMTIRLPRSLPRALGVEDIRRLLARAAMEAEVAGSDGGAGHSAVLMHFVVLCLFATGLRIGELAGIRLPDLDLDAATIVVRGKGNRERKVFLPNRTLLSALRSYLRYRAKALPTADALLVTGDGDPVATQQLRRALIRLAKRAAIDRHVTPHMLRHTAATQLIEAGVDIRFVQKLLGHASIATTQIYTQVSDSSLHETLRRADTLGRLSGEKRGGGRR